MSLQGISYRQKNDGTHKNFIAKFAKLIICEDLSFVLFFAFILKSLTIK